MKICPKCNSSYSDETLIFCLTDGVPLVEGDALTGNLSGSLAWQEAETIYDENLKIHFPESHVTSPNSSSDTVSKFRLNTSSFITQKPKKPRPYLIPLVGFLAMISVAGAIFWWLYANNNAAISSPNKRSSTESSSANRPRVTVALTADQQDAIKKEVADVLEAWRKSIEKRDADQNVKFYDNTLETYYKESGIDRNHVRADRQRAIDRYESLSLQVDNLKVTPETTETASATFDKTWIFKNPVKTSTGSVQQEMYFIKQNGKWLINGEKDLKVYYINNRENNAAETNSNTDQ
jgi:hypothetical protein